MRERVGTFILRPFYTWLSGGTIFGDALALLIATTLVEATSTALSVSVYIAVMAVISLVCMLLISNLPNRYRRGPTGRANSIGWDRHGEIFEVK